MSNTAKLTQGISNEVSNALSRITFEHLQAAYNLGSANPSTEKNLIQNCEALVMEKGISFFVRNVDSILFGCKVIPKQAKLETFICECGVPDFMKLLPTETIRECAKKLLLITDQKKDESQESLPEDICDEIMLRGMEDWLKSFPRRLLEQWCTNLGVTFTSSSDLVDKLMVNIFALTPLLTEGESSEPLSSPALDPGRNEPKQDIYIKTESGKADENETELEKGSEENPRKRNIKKISDDKPLKKKRQKEEKEREMEIVVEKGEKEGGKRKKEKLDGKEKEKKMRKTGTVVEEKEENGKKEEEKEEILEKEEVEVEEEKEFSKVKEEKEVKVKEEKKGKENVKKKKKEKDLDSDDE